MPAGAIPTKKDFEVYRDLFPLETARTEKKALEPTLSIVMKKRRFAIKKITLFFNYIVLLFIK